MREDSSKRHLNIAGQTLGPVEGISKLDRTYNELFNAVSELDENNLIVRRNCKFCNHPIRHDAEKKWEQVAGSFSPVKKFFETWEKDNPGYPKMNGQNIRNHLLTHYAKQEQRLWLQEYAKECQSYMNYKISQDHRFEMLRAVIEKQLFDVGSNPTLDVIKKSDQMVKLTKSLLDIDECQAKLRGDLKPVSVITERFMDVWLHVINSQENEQTKIQLLSALDQFQEHMQEGISMENTK